MNLRNYIWLLMTLLVTGCYADDFFEDNKDAFYKLYGNGTIQEAVAMQLTDDGDIYLIGNQEVRNQDSCAVVIIRTDGEGNQRWSARHFGKGYSKAMVMLVLPGGELLLLAASRPQDQSRTVPVLYKLDAAGNLLNEFFLETGENTKTAGLNHVPEDMVLAKDGAAVFVLGNMRDAANVSKDYFIKKIDIETGATLGQRLISNYEDIREARQIFWRGEQLLVIGNTRQIESDFKDQSMFMAPHSVHMVEAGHTVIGSGHNDSFHKATLSAINEFVILSSEKVQGTGERKSVLRFVYAATLGVRKLIYLEYDAGEIPEAIEEDEEGNLYVALTTFGERGNTNILINKMAPSGDALWDAPKEIGGEGNDRIVQMEMKNGFVYLLKTIDMQNENKLISLSKIRL